MTAPFMHQAIEIGPPIMSGLAGAPNANLIGVLKRATVATAQLNTIPTNWFGRYWMVQAVTSNTAILFGDSTVVASLSAVSSGTPPDVTLAATSSLTLIAGQPYGWKVPNVYSAGTTTRLLTHFSHISADTNGYLEIFVYENY